MEYQSIAGAIAEKRTPGASFCVGRQSLDDKRREMIPALRDLYLEIYGIPGHCRSNCREATNSVFTIVFLCLGISFPSWADGTPWETLSEEQRKILKPVEEKWDSLPREKQLRLQKGAKRWASMPQDQRRKVKDQFKKWEKLSPGRQPAAQ
ncbi:MAG: DUF3106 domain-containing protein [Gammaproteobacteria bacterium]|nr:DUF3106 domain-containing protein [Gammaproteobacteria bacterium]